MSHGRPAAESPPPLNSEPSGDWPPAHPDPAADEDARFARFFAQSPMAMTLTTVDEGRYVAVNEPFARLVGRTPAAVVGRTPAELGLMSEGAHRAALALMRAGERLSRLPLPLRAWDGARELLASVQRVTLDAGHCFLTMIQDLSEGVRLRAALGEAERRFHLIFDNTPVALLVRDAPTGAVLDANRRACELFGMSREALLALPPSRLPPSPPPGDPARLAHVVGAGGRVREVEISSFPLALARAVAPDPARVEVLHDVTDRLAAERAEREIAERWRIVAEESNDGLWDWNLRTGALWRNRGLLFAGIPPDAPPDEWRGRMAPDDAARIRAEYERALAERATHWQTQYRVRRADGEWAEVLQRAIIFYEGGQAVRTIGAIVDISAPLQLAAAEAQAAQAERERVARELHDLVTQHLYSANLLAATVRRQAAAQDEATAEFTARFAALVQGALRRMRLLLYELRPAVLRQEGLIGALNHRLATVERPAGVAATLIAAEEPPLPGEVEDELFWIAHAALNGILGHAGARAVEVRLSMGEGDPSSVVLEITDNGRAGWSDDPAALGDIRARAARLNADLTIASLPGHGTRLRLRMRDER